MVYRHDPVYGLIQDVLGYQLDRFAKNVPKNEFGEKVRLLRDNQRLWMLGVVQQSGDAARFHEQLAKTRADLRDYLRTHAADTWGDFNLAKTYIIEAQRRSQTESGDEEVAKLLFEAFDLLERHAALDEPYGRENAFCAAGTLTTLCAGLDAAHGAATKAKLVLDRVARTLAMLDRFDAAEQPADEESGPYQRNLVYLARLQTLAAKAGALRWLQDRDGEMCAVAEASLATAAKCPPEWSGHPCVLRFRALASGILAEVAIREKKYARAWTLMRQECDLMESSLQGIPGQVEEADRRWVLFSEFMLAQVGAEVLRSSDRHDPAARAKLSAIARDSLRALDTCANAELLVPVARRDPRVAKTAPELLEELRKYQAEFGENAVK